MIGITAIRIWTDMAVIQIDLAVFHRGVAVFEVGPSIPQGFDFGTLQDETRLEVLLKVVVEARLFIGTNDLFAEAYDVLTLMS